MKLRLWLIVIGSLCMLASMAEVLFNITGSSFMTHSLPLISLAFFSLALLLSRGMWWLAGLGLAGWAIGDVVWFHSLNEVGANPGFYDFGYVCLPLGIFGSLYLWSKRKFPNISFGLALDGLIVGTTFGALISILFSQQLVESAQVAANSITFSLLYPVLDVVLLLFIILNLSRNGWASEWSLFFVGAGIVCFTITDFSFAVNSFQTAGGQIQTWNSMDMGRLLGGMLLALAAHNPSEDIESVQQNPGTKISLPVICAVVSVAILMAEKFFTIPLSSWLFAAITLGLVIARLINFYIERDRASREKERQIKVSRNLLADMSHEMRTPLTNIIGQLEEFIRENSKKGSVLDYAPLQSALRSAGRMESTIEKLLLLARAKSNNLGSKKQVNLWDIVQEALDETEILALQHVIHVENNKKEPLLLQADGPSLSRVLINLLSNSFRHTPPGTEVFIKAWENVKENKIIICIKDNGPGIPESMKNSIWDRYVKGDHPESSGIGMALVKAIVEAHNGKVKLLYHEPGAAFLIELPKDPEEE